MAKSVRTASARARSAPTKDAPVRWGVVSTARIGWEKVIPGFLKSKEFEVRAVASRSLPNAKKYARKLGLPVAYGSYEELLAEGGRLADHGNFLWSGQLAVFVLFAVATVILVGRITAGAATSRSTLWLRAIVCSVLLAWHLVSGIRHFETSWL